MEGALTGEEKNFIITRQTRDDEMRNIIFQFSDSPLSHLTPCVCRPLPLIHSLIFISCVCRCIDWYFIYCRIRAVSRCDWNSNEFWFYAQVLMSIHFVVPRHIEFGLEWTENPETLVMCDHTKMDNAFKAERSENSYRKKEKECVIRLARCIFIYISAT